MSTCGNKIIGDCKVQCMFLWAGWKGLCALIPLTLMLLESLILQDVIVGSGSRPHTLTHTCTLPLSVWDETSISRFSWLHVLDWAIAEAVSSYAVQDTTKQPCGQWGFGLCPFIFITLIWIINQCLDWLIVQTRKCPYLMPLVLILDWMSHKWSFITGRAEWHVWHAHWG